ncbi:MBL fold metallo-hydrolase [Candidatus Woesearchaeota archaeon]|nr:MBL fold metallo-hydrolase [Candidatus Woesearchaeota archaeon]
MIKKVAENIWKVKADSNVYFLDFKKKIIIDSGNRANRQQLVSFLTKIVDSKKIDVVIFTHLHYDHVGNADLFSNAVFYASKEAINSLEKDGGDAVLNDDIMWRLKEIDLVELPKKIEGLEVIKTPGHTKGSVCLYYDKEKILFSGDTIFGQGITGRIDLPTSDVLKMKKTMIKLLDVPFNTLCPGHDYAKPKAPDFIRKAGLEKEFGY